MNSKVTRSMIAAAAALGFGATAMPAHAAGCNGVINPFVWYCAPWDNNNGPQYPYYKAKKIRIPNSQARGENKNGVPMVYYNGNWAPIISRDGAGVIAVGGGN